jgi:hypothetical protein
VKRPKLSEGLKTNFVGLLSSHAGTVFTLFTLFVLFNHSISSVHIHQDGKQAIVKMKAIGQREQN